MLQRVYGKKIKLEGFNNLTKTLSFNIYDICYAKARESQIEYLEYIDEEYNSKRLHEIIKEVTSIINAKLVHVSTQDYDPRGASVTALINEWDHSASKPKVGTVTAHLDKSHITAHTYPEHNTESGIATFRVDIDVSTCGMISPLRALNYLIESFDSDVVLMDYRVRGFTRDTRGKKIYIDHEITSIQDYVDEDILNDYLVYDINILSANIFHTKMMKKRLVMDDYLFGSDTTSLTPKERKQIREMLKVEMQEIFECHNI
ncbi:MAG TPA: adenosylmethionine decarboxylase [Spirochaetales bacterium]|nr:adenosylmethionine decarboxylase [Spirochaetales bacterium]HQK34006.1 adenosylmethionine decarboxylase [Spirochaetales bacterium]